ncbi:hypothetical protein MTO96_019726 [Rhipicephalus appendiculatus]
MPSTMITVLCLLAALIGSTLASFGSSVYGTSFGAPHGAGYKTIHNVPTYFGDHFTGISYRYRWDAPPNVWGPYGPNYGYGHANPWQAW